MLDKLNRKNLGKPVDALFYIHLKNNSSMKINTDTPTCRSTYRLIGTVSKK